MSGVGRPGHFIGKIVSNVNGHVVIEADAKDVEYMKVGETYEFDATPVGGDSAGKTDPKS